MFLRGPLTKLQTRSQCAGGGLTHIKPSQSVTGVMGASGVGAAMVRATRVVMTAMSLDEYILEIVCGRVLVVDEDNFRVISWFGMIV